MSAVTTAVPGAAAADLRGAGEAVVLLHGLGGTLSVWEAQARALAAHFEVLRYDLHGSGRNPASGPLSIEGWVSELTQLLDRHGIATAHLVGHSLGTLVIQHFAAKVPQRVRSLSLLGVNRSPPEARRAAVRQRAQDVRDNGIHSILETLIESVPSPHTRAHDAVAMGLIRELIAGQDAAGYAWSCEAMADASRPDLSQFEGALLLIAGADDTVSPPALSRGMAEEFPGARLVVLPDCGHWIPVEQPAATTAALLQFLQNIPPTSKETP